MLKGSDPKDSTFIYNEGQEIAVVFYDLGCATSGVDDADVLKSARELLGITMYGMEKDGDKIGVRPHEQTMNDTNRR